MTCSIPDCANIAERSGKCATHARLERKAMEESLKPPKTKKPIDKVGKKNTFECSDGTRVTQIQINSNLSRSYELYALVSDDCWCHGCGNEAQGHAHIIPKARCKQLNKTELIWDFKNFFPACNKCNLLCENISSPAITKLLNYLRIKSYIEVMDYERFCKLPDYSIANEPHIL